jgi:hypothetical protein
VAGGEGPGGNRVARWLWPRQNTQTRHSTIHIYKYMLGVFGSVPCPVHGTPKLFIQKVQSDNKNYNGGKIFILCRMNGTTLFLKQNKTTFKWALKAHLLEDLVEN